jgi:hypothetical protein
MERRSIETIVGSLNKADVRYLVVGGLAVVAHGFVRFTADIDLVLDPDPAAMRRAVAALAALGYRPRAPVAFEEFADPAKRSTWARDKGLMVFSVFSDQHRDRDRPVRRDADFERVTMPTGSRWRPGWRRRACRVDLIAMK